MLFDFVYWFVVSVLFFAYFFNVCNCLYLCNWFVCIVSNVLYVVVVFCICFYNNLLYVFLFFRVFFMCVLYFCVCFVFWVCFICFCIFELFCVFFCILCNDLYFFIIVCNCTCKNNKKLNTTYIKQYKQL